MKIIMNYKMCVKFFGPSIFAFMKIFNQYSVDARSPEFQHYF